MTQTTFGYDQEEDRLWVWYHDKRPRIWITRRFAAGLISPMAALIERTTAGSAHTGLSASEQVRMEHRLAVTESPTGETHYPFRVTTESREQHLEQGFVLCKTLGLRMEPHGCHIVMTTEDGEVSFNLSRFDMHLWLRAFRMALDNANWDLPALPDWLTEPVLPASIQSLLTLPLPTDLDSDPAP